MTSSEVFFVFRVIIISVSMDTSATETPQQPASFKTKVNRRLFHWSVPPALVITLFSVLGVGVIGTAIISTLINSNHTALVDTFCIDNASHMTTAEVANTLDRLIGQINLNITVNDKTVSATPDDLGLEIDTDATISNIITLDQQNNFLTRINPFPTCDLGLVATYSASTITDYLEKTFPGLTSNYKDVSIYFDGTNYAVDPGNAGTRFDTDEIMATLDEALKTPRTLDATAVVVETQPQTPRATADAFAKQLNTTLDQQFSITRNNKNYYTLSRAELASVIKITPNPDDLSYSATYSRDALAQVITDRVVNPLSSSTRDQTEFVYPDGTRYVTVSGRNGTNVTNATAIVDQIFTGIESGTATASAVAVNTTKFKVKTTNFDGNRWIDLNLSKRLVTLYNGNEVYRTIKVGIGKPSTPTVTGHFVVYRKVAGPKCMTGDIGLPTYYHLCNIHWTSYFHGAYAFHEAWWNADNHSQPAVSHGCVNMNIADAKLLYDFAPIGTPVYSHY